MPQHERCPSSEKVAVLAVLLALGAAGCTEDSVVRPDPTTLPTCSPEGWRLRNDPAATALLSPSEVNRLLEGDVPEAVRRLDGDGTSADDLMRVEANSPDMPVEQARSLDFAAAAGMADYPERADAALVTDLPSGWVRLRMAVACDAPI